MINISKYIKTLSDNEKIQELLIKTIGKILLKQNNIEQYIKENENKIIHIRDWITAVIENDEQWKNPRVLTLKSLDNAANKYFQKKNNKLQTIELDEEHEKLIADLGDYYVVQMLTAEALDNESKQMQNCIGHGGYDHKLNNNDYCYLSLRDKYNKAHVTLEIKYKEVIQLQGKQNNIPNEKYLNIIIPWIEKSEYNLNMESYGFVIGKKNNKIYSVFDLPDNFETVKGLGLTFFYQIEKLPENLIVNGNLNLSYCSDLKELPKGLVVNGNLNMNNTKIKNIPEDLIVKGNLDLSLSKIENIPINFRIDGNLNLYSCQNIEELQKGLFVNGNLNLRRSSIERIPDDLVVGETLDLRDSEILYLPKRLKVKNLVLGNNHFKELPYDIQIENDLFINKTKINKLFSGLKCKTIFINKNQVHLIKETMSFDMIYVSNLRQNNLENEFTKKDFFEKYKKEGIKIFYKDTPLNFISK